MDPIYSAIFTICGTVLTVYVTNFAAVSYRRTLDSKSLAAALAGELSAYSTFLPQITASLKALQSTDNHKLLTFRETPIQKDVVFEANVKGLGLLDVAFIEDTVFVYQQINAFRIQINIISKEFERMESDEFFRRCTLCERSLLAAEERGKDLVTRLKDYSAQPNIWGKCARYLKKIFSKDADQNKIHTQKHAA